MQGVNRDVVMSRAATRVVLGLGCAMVLGGCTSYGAVAIVPSTSPIVGEYEIRERTRGAACQDYLFGLVPIGNSADTVEAALRRAKGPLVRVTVDVESTYWVIGSTRCVIVAGYRVHRTGSGARAPSVAPPAVSSTPAAPRSVAPEAVATRPAPVVTAPPTDRLILRRAIDALDVGQSVRLTLADGRQVEGLVRARNDIKLQLETENGPMTVKRSWIERLESTLAP